MIKHIQVKRERAIKAYEIAKIGKRHQRRVEFMKLTTELMRAEINEKKSKFWRRLIKKLGL